MVAASDCDPAGRRRDAGGCQDAGTSGGFATTLKIPVAIRLITRLLDRIV